MVPDYALTSHVAPPGMVFNTGSGLPAQYHGRATDGDRAADERSVLT